MSLKHAILGLTAAFPATGYELTQAFDRSLAHAWHASHSQIYPELRKLEEAGLVEVVSEGARNSKTYAATPGGRDELRRWLVEVPPSRKVRDEGSLRLFLTALLDPADRQIVLERERAFAVEHLRMLDEMAAELDARPAPSTFRPMVDLGQRSLPVALEWVTEQIAAAEREATAPVTETARPD